MKSLFKLIKLFLVILVVGSIVLLAINKTFIYTTYKSDEMNGEGIKLERFMYLVKEKDGTANFKSPLSNNYLESKKEDYLKNLENCYNKYYYDKDNDITITKYDIDNNKYLRNVEISFVKDNYCSSNYVLSDMWVYEYNELSSYASGDITEKGMVSLIKKVYESKRVDNPSITDYEASVKIKVNLKISSDDYFLELQDFSENELLVKKTYKDKLSFAVYEMDNVTDFLNNLESNK